MNESIKKDINLNKGMKLLCVDDEFEENKKSFVKISLPSIVMDKKP